MQIFGGGGSSGILNFRCIKILSSFAENLLVWSVRVDWPRGMDVNVLSVEGNCFWRSLGRSGHNVCNR